MARSLCATRPSRRCSTLQYRTAVKQNLPLWRAAMLAAGPLELDAVRSDHRATSVAAQAQVSVDEKERSSGGDPVRADVASRKKHTSRYLPPAWSAYRQEVCGALLIFRAFHGDCCAKGALFQGCSRLGHLLRGKRADSAPRTQRDATPYGYLLSGFGAPHDVWAARGEVVVSHGSGKIIMMLEKDDPGVHRSSIHARQLAGSEQKKHMRPAADQSRDDLKFSALLQACENVYPFVLLASKKNRLGHNDLAPHPP